MTGKIGEAYVEISGRMTQLEGDLKKARSEIQGFKKNTVKDVEAVSNSFKTMMKSAVIIGIVKGFYDMGKAALGTAAMFEKQEIAFATMLKSGEKGKKLFAEIKEFSSSTPFQMPGLIETSKQLLAFGVSNEDVIEKMRNLGNAAQGNQAVFQRIAYAYGKISAKGKTSMEELNMMVEAGIPILDALQKQQGVTKDELFKMISAGKIAFKDVDQAIKNMTTGTGMFAGMLEKQSNSLSGLFSTLKDNITLASAELGKKLSPAFKFLAIAMIDATKSGGFFKEILSGIATVVGKVVRGYALLIQTFEYVNALMPEHQANVKRTGDNYHHAVKTLNEYDKVWKKMYSTSNINKAREMAKAAGDWRYTARLDVMKQMPKLAKDYTKEASKQNDILKKMNDIIADPEGEKNTIKKAEALKEELTTKKKITAETKKAGKAGKSAYDKLKKAADEYRKTIEKLKQGIANFGGFMAGVVGQVGQLYQQMIDNQITIMEQGHQRRLALLNEQRDAELEAQGLSEDTETGKEEQKLMDLEAQLARARSIKEKNAIREQIQEQKDAIKKAKILADYKAKEEKIQEEFEAKKRKLQREGAERQKQLNIAQTMLDTPTAAFSAYKAMVGIPYVGPFLAVAAATAATLLGIAKLKIIQDTPLPAAKWGGFADSPYIGGEAGPELAFPLSGYQGQKALRELSRAMLTELSNMVDETTHQAPASVNEMATVDTTTDPARAQVIGGDVYLDGDKVGEWISKGTEDGRFTIDKRSIV